ncbi:MAG: hypothetical protein Q7S88_01930 [Candidatus Daviesbacteria bacterium]|nr:hypothetical protein [Candidatus Daviesbacteria bacterium]
MAADSELSLEKRPEISPELFKGGFIVGAETIVQGSLMSMTGFALERITRERTEVPPQFRLPERPVYFLDPNSKRMVMVTNREKFGVPEYRNGLFAEIVEVDDDGKPRFHLSTSEVIIPEGIYQPVSVGPNKYNMPPSYIPLTEENLPGKEKFVPWNMYLGSLQNWMNELVVDPNEEFESYMQRFAALQASSEERAKNKIRTAFPGGLQGFDESTAPFNLIISDETNKEKLINASIAAGLYPVYVSAREFVEADIEADEVWGGDRDFGPGVRFNVAEYLPVSLKSQARTYRPAVITDDWNASRALENSDVKFTKNQRVRSPISIIKRALGNIFDHNPIFSYVYLAVDEGLGEVEKVSKESNGSYYCANNEQFYREFLYKVKADLLLTMFVRGGAPIVK